MIDPALYLAPVAVIAILILLIASIKILREYERAVVFTLGRFDHVKGPGLVLMIPFIQQMVRVDLRIQVIEIPSQDVISRDNVSMKVDAVLYFNVVNPERAATPMRLAAFGEEPPGTLLSAEQVAESSLAVLASELTGAVIDVRRKLPAAQPADAASVDTPAGP